MANYEVRGIHPMKYGDEISGGDSESIQDYPTKSKAFSFAKKESRKKKWYEVTVYCTDDRGEIMGHWYFKNGVLTWDMSI